MLSGVDGPKLATALRARRPALKTLYVSGYTGPALLHRKVLEPGDAFLSKPFTPCALARKVREVLDVR